MPQWGVDEHFSLEEGSKYRIRTITNVSRFNYLSWMVTNRRRSIDAHFHDGAGSVLVSRCSTQEANTMITYSNDQIALEIPDLQDQVSMTLCWRSLSKWGRECVAFSFAYIASQYLINEWPQPIAPQITHDARLRIVDAASTLILPWTYPPYVIIYFGIV